MAHIVSEPHPLDDQIIRQDLDDTPLPTFHYAQSHDLPYTLAVDAEIYSSYISTGLVNLLNLKVELCPKPYFSDLEGCHHVQFQCRVLVRVGSYEEEILCEVVDIKKHLLYLAENGCSSGVFATTCRQRPTFIHG